MFLPIVLSLALCSVLIFLNSMIGKKSTNDREKPSPFECGFDPKSSARVPFSLRFYLVALVFLIFDVEITLILPMPVLMNQSNSLVMFTLIIFFLMILIIGLFHEWNEGALDWDK
uniref:NADH-ubiquinone oxidoreductase chain 3 n=1 Tax=Orchesella cincta TaxID=48709 RepID=A0A1L2E115_ORCCI|nr:NADH dehydrogenase subunit 3 [Orchesella cincta]ANJ04207.1 NADH dehydrogenase subunit 3 [Orchesella cincta]